MSSPGPILGIETSCDETAAAVADGSGRVLASVVFSQTLHADYGGVVPELASREHAGRLPVIAAQALHDAGIGWDDCAAVAVTAVRNVQNVPAVAGNLSQPCPTISIARRVGSRGFDRPANPGLEILERCRLAGNDQSKTTQDENRRKHQILHDRRLPFSNRIKAFTLLLPFVQSFEPTTSFPLTVVQDGVMSPCSVVGC